jgi:hypothetical protein
MGIVSMATVVDGRECRAGIPAAAKMAVGWANWSGLATLLSRLANEINLSLSRLLSCIADNPMG